MIDDIDDRVVEDDQSHMNHTLDDDDDDDDDVSRFQMMNSPSRGS